jgi:hypothetical protein
MWIKQKRIQTRKTISDQAMHIYNYGIEKVGSFVYVGSSLSRYKNGETIKIRRIILLANFSLLHLITFRAIGRIK